MQLPNLPQILGLEIILVVVIGYLWFQSLRNRKTETLAAFFRLCSALMLFLIIDFPVRICDLDLVKWDPDIVFLLNALFIGLQTLTVYEWFVYFLVLQGKKPSGKKMKIASSLPLFLTMILLIVSYKTHWLFYVNEDGKYARGLLFPLQYLIPYSYLAASFVGTFLGYRKNRNRRTLNVLLSAFLSSIGFSILQIFFSGSFTQAGISFAVLLIYIEMYRYEIGQIEKMKSLSAVNKELETVNKKLNETVRDLEISVENEKKANNAKNEFLSRMSHDMRTPLNGILGIIEIDERHPQDARLLAENREKAKTAAQHLASMINDVLDMSKLASGKYELVCSPFVMSRVMNEICSIAGTLAGNAGISLINENADDSFDYPTTYGSPLHITQALLNIAENAIRFNKQGGYVRTRLAHQYLNDKKIGYTVTIADSGIGMSEAYIRTLFDAFSQEHMDARSEYKGSGLGMAITKALIDLMGGTIAVESKVGEGSSFVVELTFDIVPDEKPPIVSSDEEGSLSGVHILLAEDNELNIDIAQSLLEDSGAVVDVAENGRIALDKFLENEAGTYDVILMDCMMPFLDGYEATKAIRESGKRDSRTIPVIAMTANTFDDDKQRCMEAGMNEHLAKPFDIQKVIKTVRSLLENE